MLDKLRSMILTIHPTITDGRYTRLSKISDDKEIQGNVSIMSRRRTEMMCRLWNHRRHTKRPELDDIDSHAQTHLFECFGRMSRED